MKMDDLRQRLRKDRPMTTISVRMPQDVIDDLKRIAPVLGFSGYQPLLRAYVGQGLRTDLEKLDSGLEVRRFIDSLQRQGVDKPAIERALQDAEIKVAKIA